MTILIWNFLELTIISHIVNFTFQVPQLISHSIRAIISTEISFSIGSNLLNYCLVSILRNFLSHPRVVYISIKPPWLITYLAQDKIIGLAIFWLFLSCFNKIILRRYIFTSRVSVSRLISHILSRKGYRLYIFSIVYINWQILKYLNCLHTDFTPFTILRYISSHKNPILWETHQLNTSIIFSVSFLDKYQEILWILLLSILPSTAVIYISVRIRYKNQHFISIAQLTLHVLFRKGFCQFPYLYLAAFHSIKSATSLVYSGRSVVLTRGTTYITLVLQPTYEYSGYFHITCSIRYLLTSSTFTLSMDISIISDCINAARTIEVLYPSYTSIGVQLQAAHKSLNNADITSVTQSVQRLHCPTLPDSLETTIDAILKLIPQHQDKQWGQIVSLMWSIVRSVGMAQRLKLLQDDKALFQNRLKAVMTTKKVVKATESNVKFESLYIVSSEGLDTAYSNVADGILQVLPDNVRHIATMTYVFPEELYHTQLSAFLTTQCQAMIAGTTIATSCDSLLQSSWVEVMKSGQATPSKLTPGKPVSIWKLASKGGIRQTPRPGIQRTRLTLPVTPITEDELGLRKHNIIKARIPKHIVDWDIPDSLQHLRACVQYDSAYMFTSYIRLVGVRPTSGLLDASQNKADVLAECKAAVRQLGYFSEARRAQSDIAGTLRSYSGIEVDVGYMETYFEHLFDVNQSAIMIKLKMPAWFGVTTFPGSESAPRVHPMVQDYDRGPARSFPGRKTFFLQAMRESSVSSVISGYPVVCVVRGMPSSFRLHSVTGACMQGIRDFIMRVCQEGGVSAKAINSDMFDLVLTLIPHYQTLATSSSQRDQYNICVKNGQFVTNFPEILPQQVRQIDELVVQVVWLAGTSGVYGPLAQQLVQHLALTQLVNFTVCEIPMEVLPSLDACRRKPLLSPEVLQRVPFSRTLHIRPYISVLEIIYHLVHGGNSDILYDITGMFIFPAAHRQKGEEPWYLGCTWEMVPREIPPLYLQPAAATNEVNMPVSLASDIVKDKLEQSDIYGRGQRRRLSEAYARAMASPSNQQRRNSSMQGARGGSTRGGTPRGGRGGRNFQAGRTPDTSRARPAPSNQALNSHSLDWVHATSDTTHADDPDGYLWSRRSDYDSTEPSVSVFEDDYDDTTYRAEDGDRKEPGLFPGTSDDTFPGISSDPTPSTYSHGYPTSVDCDQEEQDDDNMDLSGNDHQSHANTGPSVASQPPLHAPMPVACIPDAALLEQVTRLSARYEKIQEDLFREESNLKCYERQLAESPTNLHLQCMLEGTGRIVASKRSSMKDVEKRIRETCQVLQLPAEDFVYFTDVT